MYDVIGVIKLKYNLDVWAQNTFIYLSWDFVRDWDFSIYELAYYWQWCIAKNGGGYMQRGVAKGLKVPCLFMITEVSIRCQKNPEVGIRRIPAYTPQYTTDYWARSLTPERTVILFTQ